jgi:cell cycle serine/threonine-protein kinase CDC5/MSD2
MLCVSDQPGLPSPPSSPPVFIVSWLDYCNKYGMGYALTDGSVGVHFNDSTSLVIAPDKECVSSPSLRQALTFYAYSVGPTDLPLLSPTPSSKSSSSTTTSSRSSRSATVVRKSYTPETIPDDLQSKLYLIRHFSTYMQERLYDEKPYCFVDTARTRGMDFVSRYLRMKNVIVFRLSCDVLQVSLPHSLQLFSKASHLLPPSSP